MSAYLFDTCFLIDLEREMKRQPGKAYQFLGLHASAQTHLTWIIAGEFAEGFGSIFDPTCTAMLARFNILAMDENTANQYAIITKHLRGMNQLIGTNDLWIAAAAIAHDLPLVTNNIAHFNRVPGLTVFEY